MTRDFDMGRAWSEATAMIRANLRVILIVAGVFFFLPGAISAIAMPQATELQAMAASPEAAENPEMLMEALTAFYGQVWWVLVLVGLIQAVGTLGLLALLTDRARPTVGEALATGARALIPYIAAQIIVALIIGAIAFALIAIGAVAGPAILVLMLLLLIPIAIYLWIKFSLVAPVIAIDNVHNPVAALRRSWLLTKGNSFRLLAFYILLLVVAVVVMIVGGMIFSIFAIAGEEAGLFANAIGGSLVSMGVLIVFLAVLAAAHRQLAGETPAATTAAFD